jgi:MSHA pilin protein MshA
MKNQSGFTLIELIMVIVILGILAAVAVPKFVDLSGNAKASACKANMAAIESAAAMAYADSAAAGKAKFPAKTSIMASSNNPHFATGKAPTCPSGGTYTYDETKGTVTCSIASHARS